MTRTLPITIWQEGNWFVATCPLNNVASQGKTREEALTNIQEALELYFEDDDFASLPSVSHVESAELTIQA